MINKIHLIMLVAVACLCCLGACKPGHKSPEKESVANNQAGKKLSFETRMISDSVRFWWAYCPADVTGDDIADLVFINSSDSGGYLAYLQGQREQGLWARHIIAKAPPTGGTFAAGDLECADMDGDGDIDVLGMKHPGEWVDDGAPSDIFWFENPSWKPHHIGSVPDAVKDVSLVDFDDDHKMDMAVITDTEHTLSVFRQISADKWDRVEYLHDFHNMHEGMAVGDVDGDNRPDILADAIVFYNPGGDLTGEWKYEVLDPKWTTQTGDWSHNATKAFIRDIDGDGKGECFVSHSERKGYPLVYYKKGRNDQWQEHVIADSIPACHTIQVFDFDGDGDYDVLAGTNKGRAVNLGVKTFPVYIFLSSDNYQQWTPMKLADDGIYNGQVTDYDGDGDYDIFRQKSHMAKKFYLLESKLD